MSSRDRPVHDVLGRMSDDEGEDDVPDDLDITFVPRSERLKRLQQARRRVSSSSNASSPPLQSTGSPSSSSLVVPTPTETVYERERNAKVRALLAEQRRTKQRSGFFTLDLFDGPLDDSVFPTAGTAEDAPPLTSSSALAFVQDGAQSRRGRHSYANASSRGGRGGSDGSANGEGQRRYRMPNPNMTEEEQARYIRARRNMAMTRNALREVDPETLEYTQVTQAAEQSSFGRGSAFYGSCITSYNTNYHYRGRGGSLYGGRGTRYRGRGGDGRGRGYGNGGVAFNPY